MHANHWALPRLSAGDAAPCIYVVRLCGAADPAASAVEMHQIRICDVCLFLWRVCDRGGYCKVKPWSPSWRVADGQLRDISDDNRVWYETPAMLDLIIGVLTICFGSVVAVLSIWDPTYLYPLLPILKAVTAVLWLAYGIVIDNMILIVGDSIFLGILMIGFCWRYSCPRPVYVPILVQ